MNKIRVLMFRQSFWMIKTSKISFCQINILYIKYLIYGDVAVSDGEGEGEGVG
jgi:hypothetical protein